MFFIHTKYNSYVANNIGEVVKILREKDLVIKNDKTAINIGTEHISFDCRKK